MKLHWTPWRVIVAVIATLLLIFGVKCLLDGQRAYRATAAARTARPLEAVVDFSVPSERVLQFQQTFSRSHGQSINLCVPHEVLTNRSPDQLLEGLAAHLTITDAETNLVASAELEIGTPFPPVDDAIPIFNFAPFRKGDYQAVISVTRGAPALKGVPQRLECRYLLCGLEEMPANIAIIVGVVSSCLGLILLGAVAFRLTRPPAPKLQRNAVSPASLAPGPEGSWPQSGSH